MEIELDIALRLITDGIRIRYLLKDAIQLQVTDNEILIEKYKISECPNPMMLTDAIQKKIGRSESLRSQKSTLGICILVLLSVGYSVTSLTLKEIPDTFIERCWECLNTISFTVPEPLQSWMVETINGRSAPDYASLFCQRRHIPINFLGNSIKFTGRFSKLDPLDTELPKVVWHRDDSIMRTMMFHIEQSSRDLSEDRQRFDESQ